MGFAGGDGGFFFPFGFPRFNNLTEREIFHNLLTLSQIKVHFF